MIDLTKRLTELKQFEDHFQYDTAYIRDMAIHHSEAFEKFDGFMPMARYQKDLPVTVYYVAKLAAIQIADCGACLQLNVRMALEAGVAADIVKTVIEGGQLPTELAEVYDYSQLVAQHQLLPEQLVEQMRKNYGVTGLIELALCIASASVFPLIKRSMGLVKSCAIMEVAI